MINKGTVKVIRSGNNMPADSHNKWKLMWEDLKDSRQIIIQLIKRDIRTRFRQSVLGYAWAVIIPLLMVFFFTYLINHRVLPIGELIIPYPVFAIWNIIVWQLFAGILLESTNCLVNAGALTSRINFPKESLIIAATGQPLFDFMVKLIPVIGIMYWYDVIPESGLLFIFLALIPVVTLAVGLGFFLSVANLLARDISNMVGMAVTYGLFAAPILYPPPVSWPFSLVNLLNPFSPLLITTQDLIMYGELRQPITAIIYILISFVVFIAGWRIFRTALPRVMERI